MDVRARRAPNWHLFFKNPQPTTVTELHATLRAGIAPARSLPQRGQASKHANNQLEQLTQTGTEAEIQGGDTRGSREQRGGDFVTLGYSTIFPEELPNVGCSFESAVNW